LQLTALLAIFLGIFIASLEKGSFKIGKLKLARIPGLKDILTATLLAALWTVLWGNFVTDQKDWLAYAALMYGFMSIVILLLCAVQRINLAVLNSKTWKYFMLIGLSEVIAYLGVSFGYGLSSHTSVVAVLSAAFSIPTLFLAHYFLKERLLLHQYVAGAIIVGGIVFISFA
jgi:drug/metabolite transporter (DMT)-like permease